LILVVGSIQFERGATEVLSLGEDLQASLRISVAAWLQPTIFCEPGAISCK